MTSQNNRTPVLCYVKLYALFQTISEFKLELQSGNAQFRSKSATFFVPCKLEIWWMTLKNNRAPLLGYLKLCASLHRHRSFQTAVTVRKRPIWIKIDDCFVPCDLEIWRMTLKTIGHLFYATLRLLHHSIGIDEFKIVPCDLDIWRMTSKNNIAPLLCDCKLCASFCSHVWIQTGVTIWKRPNWDKNCFDLCDLDLWPLTLTFYTDTTFLNGNGNNVMIRWQEHCEKWQTDRRTNRRTKMFLELPGRSIIVQKPSFQLKIGNHFVLCHLEIWRMIVQNNRALLFCYFKLCASFHIHRWIQNGITIWKLSICGKSWLSYSVWPWNFTDDLEKQWGTSLMLNQPLYIFVWLFVN